MKVTAKQINGKKKVVLTIKSTSNDKTKDAIAYIVKDKYKFKENVQA